MKFNATPVTPNVNNTFLDTFHDLKWDPHNHILDYLQFALNITVNNKLQLFTYQSIEYIILFEIMHNREIKKFGKMSLSICQWSLNVNNTDSVANC